MKARTQGNTARQQLPLTCRQQTGACGVWGECMLCDAVQGEQCRRQLIVGLRPEGE